MSEKTTWTFADGRKLVFTETEPGTEFSGSPRPYILYADGTEGEATPGEVMAADTRIPGCTWCGSTVDLDRSPTGWRCDRCTRGEDLVETPDYEALGYPETRFGETFGLDVISTVAFEPLARWLRVLTEENDTTPEEKVDDKADDK